MIAEKRKLLFSFLPTSCAAKKVKYDGKVTCRHLGCHCPSVVDTKCLLGNFWKTFEKVIEKPSKNKKEADFLDPFNSVVLQIFLQKPLETFGKIRMAGGHNCIRTWR